MPFKPRLNTLESLVKEHIWSMVKKSTKIAQEYETLVTIISFCVICDCYGQNFIFQETRFWAMTMPNFDILRFF